jgi:cell division protein FtsB
VGAILFLISPASAQQVSPEQVCRQVTAVLAQDNARLGAENEKLKSELNDLMSKQAPQQK